MAKITVHGGASDAAAEAGAVQPAAAPEVEQPAIAEPEAPEPAADTPDGGSDDQDDTDADTGDTDDDQTGDDQGDLFDPSLHTVADVLAYLDSVDDTERARVIDAERAGKARKTITGD